MCFSYTNGKCLYGLALARMTVRCYWSTGNQSRWPMRSIARFRYIACVEGRPQHNSLISFYSHKKNVLLRKSVYSFFVSVGWISFCSVDNEFNIRCVTKTGSFFLLLTILLLEVSIFYEFGKISQMNICKYIHWICWKPLFYLTKFIELEHHRKYLSNTHIKMRPKCVVTMKISFGIERKQRDSVRCRPNDWESLFL